MNSEDVKEAGRKVWAWGHVHTFLAGLVCGAAGLATVQFWVHAAGWLAKL